MRVANHWISQARLIYDGLAQNGTDNASRERAGISGQSRRPDNGTQRGERSTEGDGDNPDRANNGEGIDHRVTRSSRSWPMPDAIVRDDSTGSERFALERGNVVERLLGPRAHLVVNSDRPHAGAVIPANLLAFGVAHRVT